MNFAWGSGVLRIVQLGFRTQIGADVITPIAIGATDIGHKELKEDSKNSKFAPWHPTPIRHHSEVNYSLNLVCVDYCIVIQ